MANLTLLASEAALLQAVINDDMQNGASDFRGELAIHKAALAKITAHIISGFTAPLALSSGESSLVISKLLVAHPATKTSTTGVSALKKLQTH